MKRAAIYARVSTHNGQNPEMQLEEIRTYCANRGWAVTEEYVDTGISGAKEHRPGLDRLLLVCRKRLVDAVVLYRYDRFARSLQQLVNALEEFRALGIDFVSLHEGVDTSTPKSTTNRGRPRRLPLALAEARPDRTRSRISSRSNSAIEAKMPNTNRPLVELADGIRLHLPSLERHGDLDLALAFGELLLVSAAHERGCR